jgi:hypothetical protein
MKLGQPSSSAKGARPILSAWCGAQRAYGFFPILRPHFMLHTCLFRYQAVGGLLVKASHAAER